MNEETTTGLTVTVREEDMTTTNELTISNVVNFANQINTPILFSPNWLGELTHDADLFDVENDFRFKRDQKTMIMRMKKKERRKYLKTLRSFLNS